MQALGSRDGDQGGYSTDEEFWPRLYPLSLLWLLVQAHKSEQSCIDLRKEGTNERTNWRASSVHGETTCVKIFKTRMRTSAFIDLFIRFNSIARTAPTPALGAWLGSALISLLTALLSLAEVSPHCITRKITD